MTRLPIAHTDLVLQLHCSCDLVTVACQGMINLPAQQLQQELEKSVAASLQTRRPVLTHLNADTSWLLQLPRPKQKVSAGRFCFNILIDPWLKVKALKLDLLKTD